MGACAAGAAELTMELFVCSSRARASAIRSSCKRGRQHRSHSGGPQCDSRCRRDSRRRRRHGHRRNLKCQRGLLRQRSRRRRRGRTRAASTRRSSGQLRHSSSSSRRRPTRAAQSGAAAGGARAARPPAARAAAGSGKTSVMVRRVCHMLARGVGAPRILCVTFTRAAAEEMQTRLVKAIGPRAKEATVSTFTRSACRSPRTPSAPATRGLCGVAGRQQQRLLARTLDELRVRAREQ